MATITNVCSGVLYTVLNNNVHNVISVTLSPYVKNVISSRRDLINRYDDWEVTTNNFNSCSQNLEYNIQLEEIEAEESLFRNDFVPSLRNGILFSKKIEFKVDELPSWKPFISLDSYCLEDYDE